MTLSVHFVLAITLTASPAVDPTTCASTDYRCTAEANLASARAATSDGDRAHRLYRAHRAYLALARKAAPDRRAAPLCRAAELLDQVRALHPPAWLSKLLADTTKETEDALAGIDCSPPKRHKKASGPRVTKRSSSVTVSAADPSSPATGDSTSTLLDVRARSSVVTIQDAPPPAPPAPETASPDRHAEVGPRDQPMTASPSTTAFDTPPGRRLLIGGGVAMAAGVALGGAATYLGLRAARARQAGVDLAATETGAAARAEGLALQDEFRTAGTVGVAVGVVGGVALVAGMAMIIVGSQRSARAREREAILLPTRTGLLLGVKF